MSDNPNVPLQPGDDPREDEAVDETVVDDDVVDDDVVDFERPDGTVESFDPDRKREFGEAEAAVHGEFSPAAGAGAGGYAGSGAGSPGAPSSVPLEYAAEGTPVPSDPGIAPGPPQSEAANYPGVAGPPDNVELGDTELGDTEAEATE